ncbi:MAG: DNA repair protein RecN [Frankiaceae bacterium]|nr:DNA repair protein RecN [Frankiaceae bacterium]MBV9870557.1 DNA repair protein RecN [Frankiaceae bacterium]
MLVELRLRGLGAIDDATLELGPGFTAVTGETGAGKTMLLTGLALLLGGRGDAGLVRAGHARVEVEGRFRIDPGGSVAQQVEQAGGALDGDEVVVARTVGADGRSRGYLGGRSVPVATLAAIADDLVTVHGQADQRGLLKASVQRSVLDAYAGDAAQGPLRTYRAAFAELAAVRAELEDVTTHRRERTLEADGLRQGLRDVDEIAPEPGEDLRLAAEAARLGHVEALRAAAAAAHGALSAASNDPAAHDVLTLLGSARRELEAVTGHDTELDGLASRVAEASYLLADISADLSAYVDQIDADPARLAVVQERISRLAGLTRRYAADLAGVLAWAEQARARLAELTDDDTRVLELTARRDAILAELAAAATALSDERAAAAKRLDAAVSSELQALAMSDARLPVAVTQREDPNGIEVGGRRVAFGQSGVDEVEIQLVPHAGAPARPVHRGASGGELSRVMLAIEIVLAGADAVPTFIFDEVDAGVGGRAAIEVGRRLAGLARTSQVLVVTHLPQVAAFADRHVVVAKTAAGHITSTEIDLVDGDARLRELSRMLGGLEDSSLGHDHAEELLATAAVAKGARGGRLRKR